MPKKANKTAEVMVIKKFGPAKVGDIVKLRKGYVHNYLIPNGLCISVQGNEDVIQKELDSWKKNYEAQEASDKSLIEKLTDMSLLIRAESGIGGSLYGSITASNVVKQLEDSHNIKLLKSNVILNPIKFLGNYDVEVNIHGLRTHIKLEVVPHNS